MITADQLVRLAGQHAPLAEQLAPELASQLNNWAPLRVAHFLAQCCYESAFYSKLQENLNYSAGRIEQVWPRLVGRGEELQHNPQALANAVYANKYGNGDEASGDGWKYRGQGLIQITFKWNYTAVMAHLDPLHPLDIVTNPTLATTPAGAVASAIAFWKMRGCDSIADNDNVVGVTKLINPALEGLTDRKILTVRAKGIFT